MILLYVLIDGSSHTLLARLVIQYSVKSRLQLFLGGASRVLYGVERAQHQLEVFGVGVSPSVRSRRLEARLFQLRGPRH